jgi:3-hydroxybutyryl-CoA dehydrogenase
MQEKLGIIGTGAIACGLASTAAAHDEVLLYARSPESAAKARRSVEKICARLEESDPAHVVIVEDLGALADRSAIIEAVVEEHDAKAAVLTEAIAAAGPETILGTTTSSLSVTRLADELGIPERFVGLHVFNPVPRMKLVELAFAPQATRETIVRAERLCEALHKVPVHVPDTPGFVVNRLLFPYLFSAVDFYEQAGMPAADVDRCMTMGAAHPMGPLALLDFIGFDVAIAIGETIGHPAPDAVHKLVAEGALGKKSGRGFYDYSD